MNTVRIEMSDVCKLAGIIINRYKLFIYSCSGIQNTNAKFKIGEEVRLTCSAKNSIPEGVFVWRIGDKTLKNLQPLELSIDEDGSSVVSQDLVLVGNTMLGGQIVFCYHLQLDHTGDVINTMFIERKMQLIEDSGISKNSMEPKDYSDIDNEMIDSNEAVAASDSTFMSGKIYGENSIETTMTIIEDTISTEINAKMTPTPELPSFLNGTTRKIPDSDEASNSTLISKEFSDEDSIVSTVDSSTIRTIAKSEANTEFTTTRKVQKSFSPDTTTSLASTSDANFDTTFGTTISEDEEYLSNEIDADVFDKKTTDPEIVFDSNKIETVKNIDIKEKETVTENISTTRPRTDNEVSISNKINGDGKSPKSSSTSERSLTRTTIQNSQTSDSSKDQLQSDLDNDLITFPNMDNKENCHEIKQDIFISWGKGRLMNTPDFIKFKSFVQCKNECQARADCLAWNFSPYFGCNLKASALNEIQFSGWLSGKKFC